MENQRADPRAFYEFANKDLVVWRAIIGQRLIHSKFGSGTIFDIGSGDDIYVWIRFDNPVESAVRGLTDTIELASRIFEEHIKELTLPADLADKVLVFEQQKQNLAKQREEEAIRQKEEVLTAKHRRHMAQVGVPYRGMRKRVGENIRKTHCWKCKLPLDNAKFDECIACGWIICDCGACGCGFSAG